MKTDDIEVTNRILEAAEFEAPSTDGQALLEAVRAYGVAVDRLAANMARVREACQGLTARGARALMAVQS